MADLGMANLGSPQRSPAQAVFYRTRERGQGSIGELAGVTALALP